MSDSTNGAEPSGYERYSPDEIAQILASAAPAMIAISLRQIATASEASYLRRRLEQPVERGLASEMKTRLRVLDERIGYGESFASIFEMAELFATPDVLSSIDEKRGPTRRP